jgi:transposase
VKAGSEPEALLAALKNPAYHFKRIGLEAGPLSQRLFGVLAEAELPVVCVETRHMQAVLKAQINKTDRNDARGIAQMMRVGLYRPVHVKTLQRPTTIATLNCHRHLTPSCEGHDAYRGENSGPARMITENLTPKPGIRDLPQTYIDSSRSRG